MKHLLLGLLIILVASGTSVAQDQAPNNSQVPNKSIQNQQAPLSFKLYPTENMWTFIKLNTRNGKMWQVQYDISGNDRVEVFLNILPLVKTDEEFDGRFTLYPTQNMYNFLLLDQKDGKVWQVQWAKDHENRLVLPIY